MRPMTQHDHDDPRPLADDDSPPFADERQPDETQTHLDEHRLPDEAQTRVEEPETEQFPAQEETELEPEGQATPGELFPPSDVERFRDEWQQIQARFVDDPRDAVQGADQLVDEIMKAVTNHKQDLENLWQQGSETEDLRLALQRYRTFFNQLLPA